MKISQKQSVCMPIEQIRHRVAQLRYPSFVSVVRSSGIVVFYGCYYKRFDDELFVSFVHSRPLSQRTYNDFRLFALRAGVLHR